MAKRVNVNEVVTTALVTVVFLAILRAVLPHVPIARRVAGLV